MSMINHLICSFRINLVSFKAFRGPLFPRLDYWSATFFRQPVQQSGSNIEFYLQVSNCGVWDGLGDNNGYKVAIATVFASFVGPLLILVYPFIALFMQLCGAREPRLDPPHNRNAMTAIALVFVFVASRGPYEIYQLMKLFDKSSMGSRFSAPMGTPSAGYWSFEKDMILNCLGRDHLFMSLAC